MFSHSIRWHIQVWHGFLLVCLVGALMFGFYQYERNVRLREIDNQLHETMTPLLPRLAPPRGRQREGQPGPREMSRGPGRRPRPTQENDAPDQSEPSQPPPPGDPRPDDMAPEGHPAMARLETGSFYYVAWSQDGSIVAQSTNAPPNLVAPSDDDHGQLHTRGDYREAAHRVPSGTMVLVGTSLLPMQQEMHWLALWLGVIGFAVVAVGLTVGWWLAGRALRPIAQISAAAETISGSDLTKRINVEEAESELGQLAGVLNKTFDRLEKNFEDQVRFTADASHELRTPISVMLTQVQLSLSRERSGEEYRQTLETCERAAERMRTLVNQLLELTRADTGEATLIMEKCDLGRIGRESLEFIQPLALKKKIALKHTIEPVKIRADVMKLGQVLINLLSNAIHHNNEGVEVSLTVEQNATHAIMKVSDNGVGIPADALPHLFDRFYRVDKARSRGKGSSGLGLAICKVIVESHGGTIRAQSEPGKGAEFIIKIPLTKKNSAEGWLSSPI